MSETRPEPGLAEQYAAAIGWWGEAGVDRDFAADATAWLREEEVTEPGQDSLEPRPAALSSTLAPHETAFEPVGGNSESWPRDVAAFREWWLSEPSLDAGGIAPRIAPRGPAEARVMILITEPEAEDREILLAGAAGRLLGSMLEAMDIDPERAYFASALPRHTPFPDWRKLVEARLGQVLTHHVALVRPARLLVFGSNIPPLLGHDTAQASAEFRQFRHDSLAIPALAAPGLPQLLRRGAERARFWRRWLEWTDGTDA